MECFGLTDVGKKRKNNQDCFSVDTLGNGCVLLAVFDGMGGENGGETASALARETFLSLCRENIDVTAPDEEIISALHLAVGEANRAVYEAALSDETLSGMGTTLTAVLLRDNGTDTDSIDHDMKTYDPKNELTEPIEKAEPCIGVFSANVGDSRTYLINQAEIKQITKDHSYVQYLIDRGELTPQKAKNHPERNVLMKAVGIDSLLIPDVEKHIVKRTEKQFLLLCSDGLYNEVKEQDIKKLIISDKSANEKAQQLIALANKKGGRDNITVIVAEL